MGFTALLHRSDIPLDRKNCAMSMIPSVPASAAASATPTSVMIPWLIDKDVMWGLIGGFERRMNRGINEDI